MRWDYTSELRPPAGPLFILQMIYEYGAIVEWYWQGKLKDLDETCPSASLTATNPTWTYHGLHSGRSVTNHLAHGMDYILLLAQTHYFSSFECFVQIIHLTLQEDQSMWDLWWRKWHWDTFLSEFFSSSPVSIIPPLLIYHLGVSNRTIGGRSSET
jgi:hypothetical protein